MNRTVATIRAAGALTFIAAVVTQLAQSISLWTTQQGADVPFLVIGFFSYFTMESALAAAATLTIGAVMLWNRGVKASGSARSAASAPLWFSTLRALVVVYTSTTAVAYNVLLRPIETPDGSSVVWANEWLHVWGPALLLLDLVFAPDRRRLPWRTVGVAAVFPLAWAAYTFLRGPFAIDARDGSRWYPYPFLNPDTSVGGYASTTTYVGILTVLILAIAALVVLMSRATTRRGGAAIAGGADAVSHDAGRESQDARPASQDLGSLKRMAQNQGHADAPE